VAGSASHGMTNLTYVTPGLFETLRMHLLRGLFNDFDNAGAPPVAIVNEAFVRRYLNRKTDPLGHNIRMDNRTWRIVGVVK
jgi:hypothetical protein